MPAANVRRLRFADRGARRALRLLTSGLLLWLVARRGLRTRPADRPEHPLPPRPVVAPAPLETEPADRGDATPVRDAPRTRRRRRAVGWLVGVAAVVLGFVGANGVLAYTTGSGTGFGRAQVDNSQPVTIAPGTAVDPLFPGSSADVVATISNPNGIAIHVPALGLDATHGAADGFSVDAAHAACNLDSLRFNGPQTDSGDPFVIPPHGSLDVDLVGAVSMDTTATDACQGATLTVYLKVVP